MKRHGGEFAVLEPEWSSLASWRQFEAERKGGETFMEWIWERKMRQDGPLPGLRVVLDPPAGRRRERARGEG